MRGLKSARQNEGADTYGDDLTDADFVRYLGHAPAAGVGGKAQNMLRQPESQLDDDLDDGMDAPPPMAVKLPLGVRPAKRYLPPSGPELEKLLTRSAYKGPAIVADVDRMPRVPYHVYAAALALLDGEQQGDIKLSRAFSAELRALTNSHKHEYYGVDPLVLLCDSVPLAGSLIVYMEEAVPISFVLLALYLHCTTQLGKPYAEVQLKPYEGRITEGCQLFGVEQQVKRELNERGFNSSTVLATMTLRMMSVGEMSSTEATDGHWIADCLSQMGDVVRVSQ